MWGEKIFNQILFSIDMQYICTKIQAHFLTIIHTIYQNQTFFNYFYLVT